MGDADGEWGHLFPGSLAPKEEKEGKEGKFYLKSIK